MTRTLAFALALAFALDAHAHVGSPDVFHEGKAGPYTLFVSVRTPDAIPGVAEVTVRAESPEVTEVRVVPQPMGPEAAKHAPVPDVAKPIAGDPQSYTANVWLMEAGSWQVRVGARGPKGSGELQVPVPAMPQRTKQMQLGLGAILAVLGALLFFALVSIIGASVR